MSSIGSIIQTYIQPTYHLAPGPRPRPEADSAQQIAPAKPVTADIFELSPEADALLDRVPLAGSGDNSPTTLEFDRLNGSEPPTSVELRNGRGESNADKLPFDGDQSKRGGFTGEVSKSESTVESNPKSNFEPSANNVGPNAKAPSENRQDEASRSGATGQQQLTDEEQELVERLKARDREVRNHEQAHLSAAGPYARGGPTYTYQKGPDGKRYAIGGQVQIDTSPVSGDPQATIQKARVVRAAALAPAKPSSQDHAVAAAATQMEMQARAELMQQKQATAPKQSISVAAGFGRTGKPTAGSLDIVV